MLSTPQLIRAQLSEALTIISSHDFPANWPQLLPELVERLNGRWGQYSRQLGYNGVSSSQGRQRQLQRQLRRSVRSQGVSTHSMQLLCVAQAVRAQLLGKHYISSAPAGLG
jgi:hypothetical protein